MPDSRISQKVIFWGLGMRHDRAEPARSEAAIRGIGIQGARHCRGCDAPVPLPRGGAPID